MSERCDKKSEDEVDTGGYKKYKDDIENKLLPYCKNQTDEEKTEACQLFEQQLKQFTGMAEKEIAKSEDPAPRSPATEISKQGEAVTEDTILEATL